MQTISIVMFLAAVAFLAAVLPDAVRALAECWRGRR